MEKSLQEKYQNTVLYSVQSISGSNRGDKIDRIQQTWTTV